MNFMPDASPYVIIIGILIIIYIFNLLIPIERRYHYRNLPAEQIENCAVCGQHTPHGKKRMFYEGVRSVTRGIAPHGYETDKEGRYIGSPQEFEYETFEPEKRIFLVVCNTCKNRERLKEFLSTLRGLFTKTIRYFFTAVIVVFISFLLNMIIPEMFFGHFYLFIKVIGIIALISISLEAIFPIYDLLRIIFNGKSYQKKLEAEIVRVAFEKKGRSIVAEDKIG